ncbi:glycosyltransferase family 39 protein [Actinocatenispora sera]|uniref:glycosyltransferase family 39 protein n=1 Tax=Actinocatenispora sera TaxID=390989 RepID=UPI0033E691D8
MDGAPPQTRPTPLYWRALLPVALVLIAALLALATRYGYHRDELYFRLLGRHLAIGYVDQPVGTPALARLFTALFGDNLVALRLPAALAAAGIALLAAALAAEFGAGRRGQLLAAIGTATGVFPLIGGHVLLTSSVDLLIWLGTILCSVRALLRDPRWWLAAGAVAGVGLLNKQLIVLLAIGLAVGLAALGPRRTLRDRYLWLGVAVAAVFGAPSIVYQIAHGFPQLAMASALSADDGTENRIEFVPFQLVLLGPLLAPIWFAGLGALARRPAWRPVRCLVIAYPVAGLIALIGGGRADYVIGLVVAFFATGCAVLDADPATTGEVGARSAGSPSAGAADRAMPGARRRRWLRLAVAAVAVDAVIATLISLPVLPVRVAGQTPIPGLNPTMRDAVGWPAYVHQVEAVYRGVPEPAATALLAANYGEAGALDRFGTGLPTVHSGQNELWEQGPPPDTATAAVVVGLEPADLPGVFAHCEVRARLDNGVGVDNEEQGRAVLFCTGRTAAWPALWPRLHHLD